MTKLIFLLVIALISPLLVCGDRRRINNQSINDKIRLVTSSIEECALLGSCTAEDCILGGTGSSFLGPQFPQGMSVRRASPCLIDELKHDECERNSKPAGFGSPPTFKSH